jgi:hypothetical protein
VTGIVVVGMTGSVFVVELLAGKAVDDIAVGTVPTCEGAGKAEGPLRSIVQDERTMLKMRNQWIIN